MIKSKIDARERALEFVKPSDFTTVEEQIECAKKIEAYLIGDAELPEVTDDNAHIKELLEIANKSFDNSRKYNKDEIDCLFKGVSADVTSKIPCKSEVE